MILMGTGHRPGQLAGWRESPEDHRTWQLRYTIRDYLAEHRPDRVISGMAQGFDLYLAVEALNADIPLTAAMPTGDHGENWPSASPARALLGRVLSRAKEVISVGGGKSCAELGPSAYHARNTWMLEHPGLLERLTRGHGELPGEQHAEGQAPARREHLASGFRYLRPRRRKGSPLTETP